MENELNPNLETTNDYTLDPSHQSHVDVLQERTDYWDKKEN